MDIGNYDGCALKESVTSTTKNGLPQMILTFSIANTGATRPVRFMLNNDKKGRDGKTNLERSTEHLQRLGFNGNFEDPEFSNANDVTLNMRMGEYNGQPQEEWQLGFKHEKAASNVLNDLNRSYRALAGGSPTPASAKKAPAPPAPAKKGPPAKEDAPIFDTSDVTDRDTAFQCGLKYKPDLNDDNWNACVIKCEKASKRKEANFTVEDWQAVAYELAALSLPF